MFGTGQTNTLSAEIASLFSIFRSFGIGADFHGFDFVNPRHQLAEVAGHFNRNGRNLAFDNLAFAAVQRYPVAFFNNGAGLGGHGFVFVADGNVMRTGNARRTHTAGNNGRVRGHAAAGGNNALGSMHAANVFRTCFITDKDNFFAFGSPSFGIFGIKDGTADGSAGAGRQTGSDNFLRSLRIQHRVQQLVKLFGTDAHNGFFFVQQAFFNHFNGHADGGGGSAFAVTALQHPEFAVFNGEFHILHVFVVIFKVVANVNQFLIQVGPFFFQRSAVTLRGHRLRRTNTGHNVFTLCINQIFAVVNVFAGRRVTGEANAGSAVIARITKDHGLNVNGCAPVARNVVELAVGNGAVNHPGTKYGADTGPQLFPRILRNNFAQLFADFFIFVNQLFEVFRSQIRIRFVAFGLFHIFQSFFIQIQIGAHNHVRKHLQETAIRVISKSFASGSFSQSFNGFVVQTEVQNRIHHTRHRNAGAGTNREQQRIIGVGKFFAHNLLNAGNSLANLIFEVGRILVIIVVIIRANFRCDGESRRYRQTDLVHFCKVGTFTAEEITHGGVAFGLAVTKCIYPFTHGYYSSYSNS